MSSILLEKPDKQHPVLDYEKCERLYESAPRPSYKQQLDGEWIGSPFDLYSVETIRKSLEIENHPSLPVDVFVWGEGEPAKPYLTKVGGVPYLQKEREWPRDDTSGEPYMFLAQICFVDSKDVVPIPVPGDVLLLFVKHTCWDGTYLSCYEPDDLAYGWVQIGDQPHWDQQDMKENGCRSIEMSYFGVIHRTRDYGYYGLSDEVVNKLDAMSLGQPYLIEAMEGTKIGGIPRFIQNGPDNYDFDKHTWDRATFIGQFASSYLAFDIPFPYCNREKPEELYGDESTKSKGWCIGDAGSIYFFMEPDGSIVWLEECY
jgi:hypothetical protein